LLKPTCYDAHYLKAKSYQKIQDYNSQCKFIELALESDPNSIRYLINKSEYLISIKEYQKALALLESLEEREPNKYSILYSICRIYILQNKGKEFDAKIVNALALFPADTGIHHLISARNIGKRNYKKAIESAEKSLEISPTNNDAQRLLEAAEVRLKNALDNAPDYSPIIGTLVLMVSAWLLIRILDFLFTYFVKPHI
jgi:tetratricopeptide (TPR) repeat protein